MNDLDDAWARQALAVMLNRLFQATALEYQRRAVELLAKKKPGTEAPGKCRP